MRFSTRGARKCLPFLAIIGAIAFTVTASAGDKLTEANMTQRDYRNLTQTASSVPDQPPTAPPVPVHNFDKETEKEVTDLGGVKVISGRDWTHETPEKRDEHLRRIKETMPEHAVLIVTVPKGDVWLIPPAEGAHPINNYGDLIWHGPVRLWYPSQIEALPAAVARDKSVSQSDKGGTKRNEVRRPAEEAP